MNCDYCNTPLRDDDLVCGNCGDRVAERTQTKKIDNLKKNLVSVFSTNFKSPLALVLAVAMSVIALSNFVNANISNVHIVANYNYRSLVDHIGSGKDWDLARRKGGINIVSPFTTSHTPNAPFYSYHMEALISMKQFISELSEDYIILTDSDRIMNIDFRKVLKEHIISSADMTLVTVAQEGHVTHGQRQMFVSHVSGKVTGLVVQNEPYEPFPDVSLNIFVMKTDYLRKLIKEAEETNIKSFTEYMVNVYRRSNFRVYRFDEYVSTVSSFMDYYRTSIELCINPSARASLLLKQDFPIYTRVHNSAPTVYKPSANVKNSMIADDCVIEGTVINSVLSRGVHVAKGAVVRNSVLFWGTYVGTGASLNCVVTDKNVHISDNVTISGNANLPIYIEKGRRV